MPENDPDAYERLLQGAQPPPLYSTNVLMSSPDPDPWAGFAAAVREVAPKLGIEVKQDGHELDLADAVRALGRLADRLTSLEHEERFCRHRARGHVHGI